MYFTENNFKWKFRRYLGTAATKNWRSVKKINTKIAMAKEAFIKMTLFSGKKYLKLKKRLVRCYV